MTRTKNNTEKSKSVFSEDVENTFESCLSFFPEQLHPKGKYIDDWKSEIEKLNRLDKIPFELITEIVQRTRADSFWSKNFMSILKLRKKNPDGIPYIVVFKELTKKVKPKTINRQTEDVIRQNLTGWEID